MTATVDELLEELTATGVRAALVPVRGEELEGVNVWADPDDRHPYTTVWPPVPSFDSWTWGPRFEYQASRDTSARELAQLVKASIRADA